ncbi:MFS transporter [Jatrophihabitans sp. DSM 45814]
MFTALRSRDFRLLWLSQSASTIGDALVIVAIGIYVTRLTDNPSDVGLVLAAYSIPLVVFVLFGGVLADRLPRQQLMIITDLIRAVLHTSLAILIATGHIRIWHMVVIGVLFGTAEAFFRPAYTGLVPQTVAESDIQSAQALGGVSQELAAFASPALATALVLGVGGAYAFGLDALTFLVSASMLSRIRARSRGVPGERTSVVNELREGWQAVRERSWVWGTIAAFSAAIFVALAPFYVLGAAVSRDVYGTEAVFGLTNAAWGVGTVTGAVIGARWRPRRPMRTGMIASIAWPAAISLYAAGPPLPLLYPAMAAAGFGLGVFAVWWETALAQRIPPHLLSRVSAWDWMGSLALLPAGYLLAGPIADALGDAPVMLVGGLIGTAACILGLLPKSTRTLGRYQPYEVVDGAAARGLGAIGDAEGVVGQAMVAGEMAAAAPLVTTPRS